MSMRALAVLALGLLPLPAQASGISFDLGLGTYATQPGGALGNEGGFGTWSEGGFDVRFTGEQGITYISQTQPLSVNYLSDSGCCDQSLNVLDISRGDGLSFSFTGMDFSGSHTDTWLEGTFVPLAPDGNLATTGSETLRRQRLVYDNLSLQAARPDGSTATVLASTFLDLSTPYDGSGLGGEGSLLLDAAELQALSGLSGLTISLTGWNIFDAARASRPFLTLSPLWSTGLDACLIVQRQERCLVEGLGVFIFSSDSNYNSNYSSAAAFTGLQLSVDTETPAPVPLPGAAWALALGLGTLAAIRRRA